MMLYVAQPPLQDGVWQTALGWLTPAIKRGGETAPADVRAQIDRTEAQLWTAWSDDACRAALVTTRHGETLHLWLCGGHGCDWPGLLRQIMDFARGHGVTRWSIDGRKGWARVLKEVPNE